MTRPRVVVGPNPRRDLDAQARWLAKEAPPDVAARFAKAAATTFQRVAETPGIGSPVPLRNPAFADLRKWRVQGFPKLLVLYAPTPGGIRVARVLHAARDWMGLLGTGVG